MTDVRRRVRDHVRRNPGVHFNQLVRNLDIATGQAQYHLRRLGRSGDVVAERIRGRTHYFDTEYDAWERRVLSLYRRETARELITHLVEDGRLPASTLADRLDLARSTVSWHVDTLEDAGVVERSYGDRGRVEVSLTRPSETVALLQAVTPSLSDRLVDRFMRLVDAGLHGAEAED
ncbi:winged helix-turn-helix transcriptional regulator [Haloplanus halophilus]|uniref:winged helix-turn-helix transcriptional regulator n=1 Tax=Haloplanus halophilus TaxID=2949993 RepID=UPI00203BC10C|nr:winged helix-turn-helix transcriptional regulator [Haloplanus sp. GDY1]